MTPEISAMITIVSVGFALFSGTLAIRRNNRTDDRASASEITTVIVKLENICDDVKEIKENIRGLDEKIQVLDRRVTIAEQSIEFVQHRFNLSQGYGESNNE